MKTIETLDPKAFRGLITTIGELPSSFVDSMSYYEMIAWLVDYIKSKVIPAVNNNAEAIKEIQKWIETLDLQDEVDNKLDEMAASGELAEIISQYLNSTAIFAYDSVTGMKSAENLVAGSYARTLGHYSANDGGGALYKIRNVTNDDTIDEAFIIEMGDGSNQLVAELVYTNEVSILQLGAKKFDGTKHDIKPYIDKYIAKLSDTKRFTLKIPYGLYHSDAIVFTSAFSIIGDEGFGLHNVKQTTISSLSNNQEYIFSIGNQTTICRNFVLKNITFTSADYTVSSGDYVFDSTKTITNAVIMKHACFGITDNIFFDSINGNALKITTSFEIYFKLLNFRNIDARNTAVVIFAEKIDGVIDSPNISACNFEKIMFEQTLGSLFLFEHACRFTNNHFGVINFEDHTITRTGVVQTTFTTDNITTYEASNPVHWSIFEFAGGGELGGTNIDSLDLNNFSYRFSTINEQNYAYDRIFNLPVQYAYISTTVNNINIAGQLKNADLIYSHANVYELSTFKIGKVSTNSAYDLLMNVENFTNIECDTRIKGNYSALLPFLPSNITPAFKVAPNRSSSAGRVLKYDADAQNNTKVCAKVTKAAVGAVFVLSGTTIAIRAKIANGATPTIAISGTRYATTQLTGTGYFKVYELTLHESAAIGDTVQFGQPPSSSGEDILVDWICMK